MDKIRTGLYKTEIIRKKEEIIVPRKRLEQRIEEITEIIKTREFSGDTSFGNKLNVERLKRIEQTGYLLLGGDSLSDIASKLTLKYSTIKSYILVLK